MLSLLAVVQSQPDDSMCIEDDLFAMLPYVKDEPSDEDSMQLFAAISGGCVACIMRNEVTDDTAPPQELPAPTLDSLIVMCPAETNACLADATCAVEAAAAVSSE